MRRLYLQIYVGFVILALFVTFCAGMVAWSVRSDARQVPPFFAGAVHMIAEHLPPAGRPARELQGALVRLAHRLHVDATVWGPTGERLASVGEPIPAPPIDSDRATWNRRRGGPPGVTVKLRDGRWLALGLRHGPHGRGVHWLLRFALLAGILAIGTYPVARRIAGRLERLRSAVDDFGAGELSARVPVEGHDEVADVARSFNRAADRIENLLDTQKRLLSSASHELRSPLARLRVAVELMGADASPELLKEAETDITELDVLIEDLLLAARLDSRDPLESTESVDLLPLLLEESARVQAEASGVSVTVDGNARLLRRLIRNLLENARRYGGDGEIEARVGPLDEGAGALLAVADRGPGVPVSERARIFEPFYRPEGASEGKVAGSGLGLSLVREIARRHGGEVRCRAREGGGSVFEVDLRGRSAGEAGGASSRARGKGA